jgi:hypothetical protein
MHPELMKQLLSEHVDTLRRSAPVADQELLAASSAAAPGSDSTRRSARRLVGELLIRSGYRLAGPGSDGRDMVTA